MASSKLPLAIVLLLSSAVILQCAEGKVCPFLCVQAEYMTCKSSGDEKLQPVCNCCLAPQGGCTIYLTNGSKLECT
ncbi:hypothetical protein Cni_G26365 [Canna indica]|uniref:Uncharacterized protein n=1 Tax=Canna indica TaxID=4628 RepID=A0AAQ3L227_9LILI|nr:hypothetical protein Cni_G26365 [Canna indica]